MKRKSVNTLRGITGAVPLHVIRNVAQHRHGLQRDFKLQHGVLHLQLLQRENNGPRQPSN